MLTTVLSKVSSGNSLRVKPSKNLSKASSRRFSTFDEQRENNEAKARQTAYKLISDTLKKPFDQVTYKEVQHLLNTNKDVERAYNAMNQRGAGSPVKVVVTGASGQIGYALLFRIASGQMTGGSPVSLHLLELPGAMKALEGVVMELNDCAFPLLKSVVATDNVQKAFEGVDYALLVGAKPRGKGMERGDLLKENAKIFAEQGKALNGANKDVKVLVVGNPANTNAMITSHFANKISPRNITAMTRLDHNRGLAQLAAKTNSSVTDISKFVIWGNHSATQYPDVSHTQIKGKWAKELVDDKWVKDTFIPTVQQRGAAIINARGASSAASAANAAIDHMRDWIHGTPKGEWQSMAICSEGEYGVNSGLWYSYPVTLSGGKYNVVPGVPIDSFSAEKMEATHKELQEEKKAVESLLK